MIHIYDEILGVYVYFNGQITEVPKRLGVNTITSTRGRRFQEYTRGVIDLTIEIQSISKDDYNSLVNMFFSASKLYIEDLDTAKTYIDYMFADENISLTRAEDYGNKQYYYKGTLNLMKA